MEEHSEQGREEKEERDDCVTYLSSSLLSIPSPASFAFCASSHSASSWWGGLLYYNVRYGVVDTW